MGADPGRDRSATPGNGDPASPGDRDGQERVGEAPAGGHEDDGPGALDLPAGLASPPSSLARSQGDRRRVYKS